MEAGSLAGKKVYVAGHRGLVGSAVCRELAGQGLSELVTRTHEELDLRNQQKTEEFLRREKPDVIILAAAMVGGINANNVKRWEFLHWNLQIQSNILGPALDLGTEKVVFLGSSCIYPQLAPQPIKEEDLLTGPLEPTNEPYAIAKIAGLKMVEAANRQYGKQWLSIMPTNLYGMNDNFDLTHSHVLPAMIRRFHEAKLRRAEGEDAFVELWGTGKPMREFMHVDDLARAISHLVSKGYTGLYNVGTQVDQSILELANLIQRVVGYDGPVRWDSSRPDGTPRKLMDSTRIRETGWKPLIGLEEGIRMTYDWYVSHVNPAPTFASR
jgi:GDP-L-fucose synthase